MRKCHRPIYRTDISRCTAERSLGRRATRTRGTPGRPRADTPLHCVPCPATRTTRSPAGRSCATSERGASTRLDVCDAHPELLRAAPNIGDRRSTTTARSAATQPAARLLRLRRQAQAGQRPVHQRPRGARASSAPRATSSPATTSRSASTAAGTTCAASHSTAAARELSRADASESRLRVCAVVDELARVLRAARDAPQLGLVDHRCEPGVSQVSGDDVDPPDEHELLVGDGAVLAARGRVTAAHPSTALAGPIHR